MRTIRYTVKVYEFDELSEKGRARAINDEITYQLETYHPKSKDEEIPQIERAIKTSEQMSTPWFLGQILWEQSQDWILENLREGQYLENGEWFIWDEGMMEVQL